MIRNKSFVIYLLAITLALLSGFSGNLTIASVGQVVSDIFIRIFRCISTPIIALSIIVTLANFTEQSLHKVWRKSLLYTISTTLIAASCAAILYLLIKPQNVSSVSTLSQHTTQLSYLEHVSSIIPTNFFTPFLEQQVMSVLLISLLVGSALRFIPDKMARMTLINFFKGMHGVLFVITKWIIAILPIGLYGFITTTIFQFKSGAVNLSGIGQYLAVIICANLVQGLVILPLWLSVKGINPLASFRGMLPALSLAFFSKSSAGTLPVTIETAETRLQMQPKISRFVLPLCTTINMNGCAAFIFVTVMYLLQNNGVELTAFTFVAWIFIATIAAIGNAGVPMGCFFLSASLLSSMNTPINLLGLILPFYTVIDMIETALNVWSDSCVANVLNKEFILSETDSSGELSPTEISQ